MTETEHNEPGILSLVASACVVLGLFILIVVVVGRSGNDQAQSIGTKEFLSQGGLRQGFTYYDVIGVDDPSLTISVVDQNGSERKLTITKANRGAGSFYPPSGMRHHKLPWDLARNRPITADNKEMDKGYFHRLTLFFSGHFFLSLLGFAALYGILRVGISTVDGKVDSDDAKGTNAVIMFGLLLLFILGLIEGGLLSSHLKPSALYEHLAERELPETHQYAGYFLPLRRVSEPDKVLFSLLFYRILLVFYVPLFIIIHAFVLGRLVWLGPGIVVGVISFIAAQWTAMSRSPAEAQQKLDIIVSLMGEGGDGMAGKEEDKHKPGTTEPIENPLVPTNPLSGIGEWLSRATFQNLKNITAGYASRSFRKATEEAAKAHLAVGTLNEAVLDRSRKEAMLGKKEKYITSDDSKRDAMVKRAKAEDLKAAMELMDQEKAYDKAKHGEEPDEETDDPEAREFEKELLHEIKEDKYEAIVEKKVAEYIKENGGLTNLTPEDQEDIKRLRERGKRLSEDSN